jgi:hypothetical protein
MNLELLQKLFMNSNLKSYINYKQFFEAQNIKKVKISNPNKKKEIKNVLETNKINNILNRNCVNEKKSQTEEKNNNEYKDSLLNTFQDFIIITQADQFKKGIPILKIKQNKFEKNISYERKDLENKFFLNNRMKYNIEENIKNKNKNNFINKSINYNRKNINYIKNFNNISNDNINKKKHLNIINLKRKELKNILNINDYIPNIEGEKEEKKYEIYEMNDYLKKYYNKKFK